MGVEGGEMGTRIGIVGAGAIGCVVGGLLAKAGHDVTLIDQWPEHVEAMKRRGLRLSGTCGEHTIPVKALHIHEVVRAYIRDYRDDAAAELEFFKKQSSLAKAIHFAALSIDCEGKRHSHQRRLSAQVLATAKRTLEAAASLLRRCQSFAELHDVVYAKIGMIRGIGPLTVYDIATRVGGHLGLEPEVVYLHAGTSKGARALGLDGAETLAPKALPPVFQVLRPREMEDCLCIYASDLSRLRSNFAVHRTGALALINMHMEVR